MQFFAGKNKIGAKSYPFTKKMQKSRQRLPFLRNIDFVKYWPQDMHHGCAIYLTSIHPSG